MEKARAAGIIVAMGYHSQEGDIDPLAMLGTTTAVKRIVLTYQQAGISPIIIVTGFDGLDVERHLALYEVAFYRTSCKGYPDFKTDILPVIEYASFKADNIVISSVENPLFVTSTLKTLIEKNRSLIIPQYKGVSGYPIVFNSGMYEILKDCEEQKGWLEALLEVKEADILEIDDEGITCGIIDEESMKIRVKEHDKQLLHPYVKLDIDYPTKVFDSRMKMLLTLIDDTKAVKTACMMTAISVGKAWEIINMLENALGYQVVNRRQGGSRGGNTELTPKGREYLRKYELLEERVREYADEEFKKIFLEENQTK